jgi:predicted 3-demethylubiquinone-9 3-methyltransferase (glyoxalase superfamily)
MALKPSSKIFTHLWYAREAEEAASFYASVFPDSGIDPGYPAFEDTPSGPPGFVKVVDFTLFGQRFQAISAGPHHEFNDAMSIVVLCDDQAELDRYWNALLEGGGEAQRAAGSSTASVSAGRRRDDARHGPGPVEAGHGRAAEDGQARHRGPREDVSFLRAAMAG